MSKDRKEFRKYYINGKVTCAAVEVLESGSYDDVSQKICRVKNNNLKLHH